MKPLLASAVALLVLDSLTAAEEPAKLRKVQTAQSLQADVKTQGFGETFGKILGEFLQGKIKIVGGKWSAEEILSQVITGQQDFSTPTQEKKFSGVTMALETGTYSRSELMDMIAIAERGEFGISKEGRIVFRRVAAQAEK